MIARLLVRTMARVIQSALPLDPDLPLHLASLQGQSIAVELLDLGCAFTFVFHADTIDVLPRAQCDAQTHLSGRSLCLLQLARADSPSAAMVKLEITHRGNIQVLRDCQLLLSKLNLDCEGWIAQWVGKSGASALASPISAVKESHRHWRQSALDDWSDYLTEEAKVFPPMEAVSDFCDDVDALVQSLDRLEAKVNALKLVSS